MKLRTLAAVWAATALLPTAALAQSADVGVYASAGYSHLTTSDEPDVNLGAITLRGGYAFTPHFAVEAEGSFGVKDEDFATGTGANRITGDFGLDYLVGVFGVARLPITERFSVFGRAGAAHGAFSGEARQGATRFSLDEDAGFWAAGVGAEYFLDDRNGLRAGYTRYENDDEASFDAWSLSYVRRF
ncbi:porin family protein [Phenylobacterium sp.]|jgi:hypothetical protein|uniref:porin family protein n=1 Tax=Phenylobacterium sp. TaxID=1871053 RepID=UPI002F9523F7